MRTKRDLTTGPPPAPRGANRPQTLYRFYDARGLLLYVGITCELIHRLGNHNAEKPWWTDVAQIHLEHYPDRASVEAAELHAIRTEAPKHNIAHAADAKAVPDEALIDWAHDAAQKYNETRDWGRDIRFQRYQQRNGKRAIEHRKQKQAEKRASKE